MRRELPSHPHIEHLKKQAKDLLEAHAQGEAEALMRFAESLPSLSGRTPGEVAASRVALHDAQSVVAREYGFRSWNELRAEVERRARPPLPDEFIRGLAGRPLPAEVTAALEAAYSHRPDVSLDAALEHRAGAVPLLAFRDALLVPGAVAPIQVARPASLAAIDVALASTPAVLGVFTQRNASTDAPARDNLYTVGCVALVRRRVAMAPGVFLIVEGGRWASLRAVEASADGSHSVAHVLPFELLRGEDPAERDALAASLRDRAHRLAEAMPQPDRVKALVDAIRPPDRLCDLMVANLVTRLEDKARYAAEPSLLERLRMTIAMCDAMLQKG
jgi:hypothetical protein